MNTQLESQAIKSFTLPSRQQLATLVKTALFSSTLLFAAFTVSPTVNAQTKIEIAVALLEEMEVDEQLQTMATRLVEESERRLSMYKFPTTSDHQVNHYLSESAAVVAEIFTSQESKRALAAVYAEEFAIEELELMLVFFSASAGKKFMAITPQLRENTMLEIAQRANSVRDLLAASEAELFRTIYPAQTR